MEGKNIFNNYALNNYLTSHERQYIVKIIAEFWVNQERRIIDSDYKGAVQQIKYLFPTEDEVRK